MQGWALGLVQKYVEFEPLFLIKNTDHWQTNRESTVELVYVASCERW